ncbi:hypothetical protein [Pseudomonas tohonis]|uniref:hypothetical protein n=1 Tax=Pseudomonas tohonis TaxID=2725477 RepID=UPI001F1931F8|nr:hypothetical protein [Pseudomonas tohonis]
MNGDYLEGLNHGSEPEAFLAGLAMAVQAIASVVLDDESKRRKLAAIMHELSEAALHAKLNPRIRQGYLDGLSSVGIASEVSRRI